MKLQRAKGVRDFGPQEKQAREKIIARLKNIFEIFGYAPIETPVIERVDLFASKYGVGEGSDTLKESFKFQDQGGRNLILRSEFTVPLARFVGMNQGMKMPFKRYQIGQIFRDGPLKPGRYREFWQCDVDIVGAPTGLADVELIEIAKRVFQELNLEIEIRFNSRTVLNAILDQCGIHEDQRDEALIAIDKFDKVGFSGVRNELKERKFTALEIESVMDLLDTGEGTNQEKIKILKRKLRDPSCLKEIEMILSYLEREKDVLFLPYLARGLGYYTGPIMEVFLKDRSKIAASLVGGGRYDKMISGFLQTKERYPAAGISFGLETIFDALKPDFEKVRESMADFYVVAGSSKESRAVFTLARELRGAGFKTDMDYLGRSFSKALNYANARNIPYVLILGEEEMKKDELTLKDMKTGKQKKINKKDMIQDLTRLLNNL